MFNRFSIFHLSICISIICYAHNTNSRNYSPLNVSLSEVETYSKSPQDTAQALKKLHKLKSLSQTENNNENLNKANKALGIYHERFGVLDSAFHYFNLVKKHHSNTNNYSALAETYLNIESLYNTKAEYSESMKQVFLALELYEKYNNKKGIAVCYLHLCDLLYYENKYEESVSYCDKAIAIQLQLNEPHDLALTYRNKAASLLFVDGALEQALTTINKSISIFEKEDETGIPYMSSINCRGNILKYMKRYDEAIADYQSNYDNSVKLGLDRYIIPSIANIGHVYLMQEKYSEALPYNLQAIEIMKSTGNTKNLWENYMHVSKMYEKLGEHKTALDYYKLFNDEYEKYQNTIIERLESEAQVKYETVKKDETISTQDSKIAQQRKTQILYISIATLLAISLGGMYFSIKNIRKKRKALQVLNIELDTKNKQNVLLLKEIHHRVKNNLEMVKSLIALQSAQLDDSATKDAMIASQNRVQSMGIIHQKLYQGENLGSIEMKDYFVNLSDGILDSFNAEDKVKIECAMENLELDVDTAVPIGLIVNELLTNALKYAFPEDQKGNIKITLSKINKDILSLKVVDNGVGKIHGEAPKGTGFGSQLIQLLTQQLNGKMTEDVDKGTAVTFQFKLSEAA